MGHFPFMRAALIAGLLSASLGACFSLKEPPCAFSCLEPPHRCPESYSCLSDGLCHRQGATGACFLTPPGDGGADDGAAASDGAESAD